MPDRKRDLEPKLDELHTLNFFALIDDEETKQSPDPSRLEETHPVRANTEYRPTREIMRDITGEDAPVYSGGCKD